MPAPLAVIAAAMVAGCAPRDAGFRDVRQTIGDRLHADVRWAPDSAVDEGEVDTETRRLLGLPMTADAAVQVALWNNRGLRADLEDLGVARAGLAAAGLLPNPRVQAALRFPTATANPDPGNDVEFEATIDLVGVFLLPARRGVARAELEAAKLRAAGRVIDLALDTRRAFYRYQAAQQTVELERTVLATAAAGYEAAQQLRAAGNIPALDLAHEQGLYDDSRLALAAAENGMAQARAHLDALLGVWGHEAAWQAPDRLAEAPGQDPDLARLEARALAQSLDLAALQWRITASSGRLDVARALGVLPRLEAGVSARRELGDLTVGPAVGLVIPLFDQAQGEVGARRAALRRDQATYIAQAVRVRAAVRALRAQVVYTRQRAVFYRDEVLPQRQRVVAETRLQYNAMQAPVFQWLQVRRDEIAAGRAYIAALETYWNARADLAALLAGRLSDTVATPAETDVPASPEGPRGEREGH